MTFLYFPCIVYVRSMNVVASDYRDLDRSDYKNSVIGLSYTFVKVTENKQISLVDTNLNIVC